MAGEEISSSLKTFDKLEDFVEPQLPVIYPRTPGWAPKNEENPHNAWYVSVGAVDMALGTDQGGSIRSPAASCGIVGLKPTFGLVPYTGILSLESTFDNVGPMTKSVYDCAPLLEVLAGYDDGLDPRQPRDLVVPEYTKQLSRDLNRIKVGVVKEGFGTSSSDKDVDDIVRQAASQFTKTGASVDEMHSVSFTIRLGIALHGSVSPFPRDLNTALHNNVSNLGGFNFTGHPAITINTGNKVDGLPVGMMIVGKHFDESTVLKVAYAYEQLYK
ncbi:amidase-like [Saccoglossus kowalevskii]